ncbi:LOW QUALITY PROTEIN: acyl-CoA dehydrogenase [Bacillus sp. JCM 19045]|nr:LOW QUALITY PROTEIN: acyl-CoA dehydrogenase [Bacillus sp. JCM 19045]
MNVLQKPLRINGYKANFFTDDDTLLTILKEKLPHDFYYYAIEQLTLYGKKCATDIDERAKYTDRDGQPRLQRYNQFGEEVSEVWVNEGYEKTVSESYQTGMVGYVHKDIPELNQKGNYLYSFALGYLVSQTDPGFYCPVTLTMATAYLLDNYANDEVKQRFLPHVCATGDTDLFEGATFLTERQGGSDVGANVVAAVHDGDHYRLYGEKYFASNAGRCGVAMVLARRKRSAGTKGLTLFAVPWNDENGKRNKLRIRRLKDKLGVRSVPSGEVEFDGSIAYVVGDETRGFYYMMEALNLSRICNAVASIGIMRRAYEEARQYAEARHAFGQSLLQLPMIRQTLAGLKAKLEVEVAAVFDLIHLYDKIAAREASENEVILYRLYIAILKKESAEMAIHFSHEAIEMHGGNGYIEDFVTPRLLRDAQVLTVWEGTANVLGQELIRLINKFSAHELFIAEMDSRLASLKSATGVTIVREQLTIIAHQLHQYANTDASIQQVEAKPLMQKLSHVYESIVALEWAEKHGGKYADLADIYIEDTWQFKSFGKQPKSLELAERVI